MTGTIAVVTVTVLRKGRCDMYDSCCYSWTVLRKGRCDRYNSCCYSWTVLRKGRCDRYDSCCYCNSVVDVVLCFCVVASVAVWCCQSSFILIIIMHYCYCVTQQYSFTGVRCEWQASHCSSSDVAVTETSKNTC